MFSKTLRCSKGGLLAALWFFLAISSATAHELEPRVPVPTAERTRSSATAFAVDRFLTVWEEQAGGRTHLFGALSDAHGRRISERAFVVVPDTDAGALALTRIGDRFALSWRDRAGRGFLAEIDRDGALVSRVQMALSNASLTGAWNGRHFLAIGGTPGTFMQEAALVERSGVVFRRGIPLGDPTSVLHVLARSDGSFLLFRGFFSDLTAVTISADGAVGADVLIERAGGTTSIDYYGVAPTAIELPGGDVLVAFIGRQHERAPIVKTALVSASGVVSQTVVRPVSGYTDLGAMALARDRGGLSLYFRGTRERVNGAELWELAGIRLDDRGMARDAAPTVIDRGFPFASTFTYASSGEITLAVTHRFNPPQGPITSYALPEPRAVQPEPLSLTASKQEQIRLGANAGGYVAVWNDFVGQGTSVRAAAVDAAGVLISNPFVYPGHLVSQKLVSGPSDHLFLRGTSDHLIASRVGNDGRSLADAVIGPAGQFQSGDAVWTGAGYLVVTTDGSRLFTTVISGAQAQLREIALPSVPEGFGRSTSGLRVAFDGRTALLVWSDRLRRMCPFPGYCEEGASKLKAMRLSPNGEQVDSAPVEIKELPGFNGLLVASDAEFLLYTQDDRAVRILRAEAAGLDVGPPMLVPQDYYYLEDVTWNGTSFTAALRAMTEYLSVGHFDRQGNFTWQPRAARTHGTSTQSVRLATRGDHFLIGAAVAEAAVPFRAHVFDEDDLAPLPPPPPPTTVTSVEAAPNGGAVVSWVRVPGADGYTVDAFTNGRFGIIGFGGENETSKYTGWPMNHQFRVRAFNAGGFSVDWPRRRSVRH